MYYRLADPSWQVGTIFIEFFFFYWITLYNWICFKTSWNIYSINLLLNYHDYCCQLWMYTFQGYWSLSLNSVWTKENERICYCKK
jgi:hypothetical protein